MEKGRKRDIREKGRRLPGKKINLGETIAIERGTGRKVLGYVMAGFTNGR